VPELTEETRYGITNKIFTEDFGIQYLLDLEGKTKGRDT
jgi:hypothetical protein